MNRRISPPARVVSVDVEDGRRLVRVRPSNLPRSKLRAAGGRRRWLDWLGGTWSFESQDGETSLASVFAVLRDLGIAFEGAPAGWPPAAIFADLRERGLITGPYRELTFRGGPGAWEISDQ